LPSSLADSFSSSPDYKQYTDYFEKVYHLFEQNYYLPPSRQVYDNFIRKFNTKIYAQLKGEGKSDNYVRWRSAWYLVNALKSKEDEFTGFWPPGKSVANFHHDVLAQRVDLGITGQKKGIGFLVTALERHADAYDKGLRADDTILKIDGTAVRGLTQADIEATLNPVINTQVKITFLNHETNVPQTITAKSKEYFKQTVFRHDVPVDGVFCLEITHFNEMTPQDMDYFLGLIRPQNPKGLVLDLRGNPGGQVGGALEIASYFLPSGEFAYFQHRKDPKYEMDVPDIDTRLKLSCPIVILVDSGTGSAAELFSGIMQYQHRAYVLGVNTAGQILLKRSFPVGDGAEIGMVMARGYYPDGHMFGFDGITPNKVISGAPKDGLINLAAALIGMQTHGQ
jgi:carboxyl-terminal processing protease